jgi:hypothetical protein
VLLGDRERVDVRQLPQGGQSLREVVLGNRPTLATREAQRRHVERSRQQPQEMEAADGQSRIRRIRERVAQEE